MRVNLKRSMSNVKLLSSCIKCSRVMKVVSCLKMPMELFVVQVVTRMSYG